MCPAETLDAIGLRHGTDKSSQRHNFCAIYERHLGGLRDQDVALFEIGVFEGASVRMWREYFQHGHIYGLDHRADAMQHAGDRIDIFVGDQKDTALLSRVVAASGPLDVIIDDGGHRADDQQGSLMFLWPHLRPGGVYIIEDIHTSYKERWGMAWRQPGTTVEFLKGLADDIHGRVHQQPTALDGVESVHFYYELCVIHKRRP